MYHKGSQGGFIGMFYEWLRKGKKADSYGLVEKLLARGIRSFVKENPYPTLVAHPVLVPMISDIVPVYYLHGEIAVPDQAAVTGASRVYVPLEEGRNKFMSKGAAELSIVVTGLCVESNLVVEAKTLYEKRMYRIENNNTLVGGLFSSGAEPVGHTEKIVAAAKSLSSAGHGAVVFCRVGGRLEKMLGDLTGVARLKPDDKVTSFESTINKNRILAVLFNDRKQEHELTIRLFRYFDFFIAPSHERTNWAAGLGLPIFILHPVIGPFSPLNRMFLMNQRVGRDIADLGQAKNFGAKLGEMVSSGELAEMARNGYGRLKIDGFSRIASDIVKLLERQTPA